MKYERARIEALLTALDATRRALRRDTCGDWVIKGNRGHICADGCGFLIIVVSMRRSIRVWPNIKGKLDFCRVTQDGDDEGCLHLDHLPMPKEADLIRHVLRIKRKRQLTPDQRATMAARLKEKGRGAPSRVRPIRQKRKKR